MGQECGKPVLSGKGLEPGLDNKFAPELLPKQSPMSIAQCSTVAEAKQFPASNSSRGPQSVQAVTQQYSLATGPTISSDNAFPLPPPRLRLAPPLCSMVWVVSDALTAGSFAQLRVLCTCGEPHLTLPDVPYACSKPACEFSSGAT